MKLYCSNGVVVATHDDGQNVPASAYGADVVVITVANGTPVDIGGPMPAMTATDYAAAIQAHVDAKARSRGYSDGVTLASYTASTNTAWAAEAAAFVAWRDAVWVAALATLAGVEAGRTPPPAVADLIAGLPAINWST